MHHVWLLAAVQALTTPGNFLVVLLGGILGSRLAPSPELATLPLSAMIVGLALFTFPAALAMQRFGRRPCFQLSALLAGAALVSICWEALNLDCVPLLAAMLAGIAWMSRPRAGAAA